MAKAKIQRLPVDCLEAKAAFRAKSHTAFCKCPLRSSALFSCLSADQNTGGHSSQCGKPASCTAFSAHPHRLCIGTAVASVKKVIPPLFLGLELRPSAGIHTAFLDSPEALPRCCDNSACPWASRLLDHFPSLPYQDRGNKDRSRIVCRMVTFSQTPLCSSIAPGGFKRLTV